MAVTFEGKTLSIAEWANQLGISRQALHQRLQRHAPPDAIRDAPGRKLVEKNCKSYWIIVDGHELTSKQVADLFEVTVRQVRRWAKAGLLEQRAPRGFKRCTRCGVEGHYKNSRECTKNPAYVQLAPPRSPVRGIGQPGRYEPPSDLDLQALGVVLPSDEADQ